MGGWRGQGRGAGEHASHTCSLIAVLGSLFTLPHTKLSASRPTQSGVIHTFQVKMCYSSACIPESGCHGSLVMCYVGRRVSVQARC